MICHIFPYPKWTGKTLISCERRFSNEGVCSRVGSILKNQGGIEKRSERRKGKEKIDEEAELTAVSEHSETIFDTEFPSAPGGSALGVQ